TAQVGSTRPRSPRPRRRWRKAKCSHPDTDGAGPGRCAAGPARRLKPDLGRGSQRSDSTFRSVFSSRRPVISYAMRQAVAASFTSLVLLGVLLLAGGVIDGGGVIDFGSRTARAAELSPLFERSEVAQGPYSQVMRD